jgi:hypothetical protein
VLASVYLTGEFIDPIHQKEEDIMRNRGFRALSILAAAIFASSSALAVYNANMNGVVTEVLTYTDADYIYFRLSNQPTTHPSCLPGYFVISSAVPADRRKQLLARLLLAKASGETINIGYDNSGDCTDGYIRVHRVG